MKNLFYIFLLLLADWQQSEGQTIPLILSSPATVAACANNNYRASLPGQGQLQGIRIESAILYNGNTHEACGLIRGSQIVMDSIRSGAGVVITPSNIVSDSGFWSATLPVIATTDSVVMYYHLLIDCAVIPTNTSVNTMQAEQYWRDSIGVFNINNTGTNRDTSTQIKYPLLVNLSPSAYQASFHDTLELSFLFMNTGNATAVAGFTFTPDETPLCGHADTIGFSYQTGINGSPAPFYANDTFLLTLSTADTLIIKQRVLPTSCLGACTDLARLRWFCAGAQNNGSTLCDSCYGSADINYSIQNAPSPALVITRLLPQTDSVANFDTSCVNDLSGMREWRYRISTNGNGRLDSACIHLSCHDPLGVNMLSLIPFSTVDIDTSCHSCTVNYSHTLNPNALCSGDIPDPLGYFDIVLHNFGADDSITISFKTYQCVEKIDTLFTLAKYFNTWKFEKSYGRGICGDSIPAIMLPTQYASLNIVNQIGAYVNPITYYAPLVTDLSAVSENTMPFDSIWGDSALFSVQWNGYMYETINNALFGCSQTNYLTCTPKGYLRAVIETHTGLGVGLSDSSLQLRYADSLGVEHYIAPEYFYTNFSDTVCSAGHLTCYFNLETPGVKEALLNGFFDFTLKSCCGGQNGAVPYSVKYYFLLNPTGTCTGLSFPSGDSLPPTCLSTNCEWLPLSRIEDEIVVHCPGCITPGIVISNYNIRRTTYGLQDTNNDGKADVPTTPIVEGNNWFNQHRNQLSTHYASLGDRLEDRLLAYFSSGVYGTGYTYPQLYTQGAVLKHLQLSRLIPAGRDTMQLHVDTLTIYIDTPDNSGLHPCLECNEYGLSPLNYSTQRKLVVAGNAVYDYIDTSMTNYFLINLTSWDSSGTMAGNLHDSTHTVYTSSSNPLSGFFEQQRYRIKTSYSICGNFSQRNDDIITDLEDVRIESEIENKMWLTGYLKPANAFSVYDAQPSSLQALADSGWALPPNTTGTPVDSSFAGQYLFVCEDFGGKFYFFSQDVRNQSALAEKKQDCIKQIMIGSEARIGGNLLNVYPYEYHPSVLQPQEYQVIVPGQYYISAMLARNTINLAGSPLQTTPWLPYSLSDTTGTVIIPDSVFHDIPCLTDTSVTDSIWFYYGNRITRREIVLDIVPLVCTDTLTIYETDSLVKIIASGAHDQCLVTPTCAALYKDTIPTLPFEQQEFTTRSNDTITYIANVSVTSGHICFDFTLSNPPVSGQRITYAPNYFMEVPDSLEIPYLTNWTLATTGGQIIQVHDSVFTMDSILDVGEVTTYRLCADFLYCPSDTLDSLNLHLGWNCNGYPTRADADSSCFRQDITYLLQFEKSSLIEYRIAATVDTLPYTLCKPFSYTKCFRVASAGEVKPLNFVVEPPQPWLHIESVKAGRDSCSSDTTHVPLLPQAGTYTFAITDTALLSLGYTDTVLHTNDCLCGTVTFRSECDTLGGDLPNITLQGESYCGDSLDIDVKTFYKAVWDGNSECNDCFSITKTANTDSIAAYDTLTYTIQICGNNQDSVYVAIKELLPAGFIAAPPLPVPFFAFVPASGCISIPVSGYFTQNGNCPATTNTVAVAYQGYDSLNQASSIDTLFASVCVQVMPQCVDSTTIIIHDGDSSHYMLQHYSHQRFYLEGDFYITQDFTLTACNVFAAPGAHIIASRDVEFTLDSNTVIQGCGYMWQGVTLFVDAIMTVIDSSSIQDADIGIEMWDSSIAQLSSASVINSVTGIKVNGPLGGVFGGVLNIDECRFGLFAPAFKPDYPGQPIHGYLPYTGIDLYDVNTGIGGSGTSLFFNMNKGISALRSKVEVQNCKFNYIRQDNTYIKNKSSNGSALAFDGDDTVSIPSYLQLLPVSYPDTTIINCYRGVFNNYGDLLVQNCILHNVRTGIECHGNKILQRTYIQENTINASQYGIFMSNNAGSSTNNISANRIQVLGSTTGVGINVIESNNHSAGHYQIKHNSLIRVTDGFAGIQLLNVARPEVSCNVIELERGAEAAKRSTGIEMEGCVSAIVSQNSINGYTTSNTNRRGIASTLSTNSLIACNLADSTGYGFYFNSDNLFNSFRGNKMIHHLEGLHLTSTAVIDTQQHAGNQWLGNYSGWFAAVNLNAATPNDVRKSLFIVDQLLGSSFNPTFPTNSSLPPNVNNSGWFNFQLGGTTYSCGNMSNCHEYDLVLDEGSPSLLAMIALDSVLSVDYVEESQSIAQTVLYERLRRDSSLTSGNVVYQYFLNNEPVLYNLYEARTRMQESREVEDSLANLLLSLQEAMQQTEDTIRYLNQVNKLNRDTIIDTLRASLLIMRTTYVSLVNQLKTTNNALLAEAGFYNSLVTNPGDLPQQNEHFLNEVELDYETSGIDSIQNRYDQLVEIANQCPAQGGMSVYRARYYISLFNDSIEYDDDAVCLTQGIMRYASNPEKKLPPCIQVTPNPSKDEIEVTWNRVEMQQATITIFSVERKKILEQSIQKNTTIINISSLVPGVYIVEGCANGNPVCKVKIAVIR